MDAAAKLNQAKVDIAMKMGANEQL